MSSGDFASWASVILALLATGAAGVAFFFGSLRERRKALTDLHHSLTSGETAAARNVIGTLLYSPSEQAPSRLDSIGAYFALIWALQRSRNVFRTYGLSWKKLYVLSSRMRPGSRDVKEALTWNLSEIAENIVRFHDIYGTEWAISDADAWADISPFVNADELRDKWNAAQVAPAV